MKLQLTIFLILIIFFSCNQTSGENNNTTSNIKDKIEDTITDSDILIEKEIIEITQEDINELWSQGFSGLLDNKYKINMRLYYDEDEKITGYYFYESSGVDMSLKGKRTDNGFILDEFNSNDKNTGTYEGSYKNGVFSGYWKNADETKELPFKLNDFNYKKSCNKVIITEKKLIVDEEEYDAPYPEFECDNKALQKRLLYKLSSGAITGTSVEELREQIKSNEETGMIDGFVESSYTIEYNKNCIISISTNIVTGGAHFYYSSGVYNVDLHSGMDIEITDIIKEEKLIDLVTLCNNILQEKIQNQIKENDFSKAPEIIDMLESCYFGTYTLLQFYITEGVLNFNYDFDFPHVYKAAEPDGHISVPFKDIKDYIKPDGPLYFILN
ncbi:MAG: hypothetical protein K8R54_07540 [Bacteroidales bacterium]|nr:hypothetical protein [Bacteroidales bacterium]